MSLRPSRNRKKKDLALFPAGWYNENSRKKEGWIRPMCTQSEAMLIFGEAVEACGRALNGKVRDLISERGIWF
ncbi:MAG: hypothetical protein J5938_02305 [Clostridia bacterium]|nr:hypothetical protein [Clostridia bacterium]